MKLKCKCGAFTSKIRYNGGTMTCDSCVSVSLSGAWERKIEADRKKYAKDILQRYDSQGNENKEFTKAWGTKDVRREQHKYDSRTSN